MLGVTSFVILVLIGTCSFVLYALQLLFLFVAVVSAVVCMPDSLGGLHSSGSTVDCSYGPCSCLVIPLLCRISCRVVVVVPLLASGIPGPSVVVAVHTGLLCLCLLNL